METYCLVPPDLEAKLLEPLRRHFEREGGGVEVLIERRMKDRRSGADRRHEDTGPPKGKDDRRRIRNQPDGGGRRVGKRRAPLVAVDPPAELPRKARPYIKELTFCERMPLTEEQLEDQDTARLVTRIQANGKEDFAELYSRYFDRVYGYLRVMLKDSHEAEDVTQQVFLQMLEALPRYERRRQPFRAWMFVFVRNHAVSRLRKLKRADVTDPGQLDRHREGDGEGQDPSLDSINWLTDGDLLVFVERLPLAQRQVLALRFMLDLPSDEVGRILGKSPSVVRMLQHRALRYLEERLTAVGRGPRPARRRAGMLAGIRPHNVVRARRFALGFRPVAHR